MISKITHYTLDLTVKVVFISFFWTLFSVIRIQLGF